MTNYRTFGDPTPSEQQLESVQVFEDILDIVGGYGKYQKRFLYGVFGPIIFFLSLNTNSPIFYLAIPDHWCHVPLVVPMDFPSWENVTIPMEIGPDGNERFSQCQMYVQGINSTQTECRNGWDYNTVDYSSTIPSTYNWVCDKSGYATALLTASPAGTLCGTVFFGIGGDRFGRKRTALLCLTLFAIFRTLGLLLAKDFLVLFTFSFLSGMVLDPVTNLLLLIATEVTGKDKRSWMNAVRIILATCGDSILPIVAWMTGGSWVLLAIVITPPLFALPLLYTFVPESPRWLLAEGRIEEAGKLILRIANTNGTAKNIEPGILERGLQRAKSNHDGAYKGNGGGRLWQLLTNKNLAINTGIVSFITAIDGCFAFGISVNVVTLLGNPFFNYFITSIDTLPTGWLGNWLVERTGRRWTHVFFAFLAGIGFGVAIFATIYKMPWLLITILVITGFIMSMGSIITLLQAVEVFPTELRATGCGLVSFSGALGTAFAPSIFSLGQIDMVIPYIILFGISILGAIAVSFLPETLNNNLPESLEDANNLRRGTTYWSFLPKAKLVDI